MKAAYVEKFSPDSPLDELLLGERPDPVARPGWKTVTVRASALNGHDLWALRGVGLNADSLPRILGSDAAGIDEDGNEVVVYPLIAAEGSLPHRGIEPITDPLLSEKHEGTLARLLTVPAANLVPKPSGMSFEQAAGLPTAWLTAYRMLFTLSGAQPGDVVLVQGATGGVASALLTLGSAAGITMWATARTPSKRVLALQFGAKRVFEPGERLPHRIPAVMETVGTATWDHSMKVLRPGGTIVVAGATAGHLPPLELRRVFSLGLRIIGARMGTLDEFEKLISLCASAGLAPHVDSVHSLDDVHHAFRRLESGQVVGKIVVQP